MLVLKRRRGERIVIGDDVFVKLEGVSQPGVLRLSVDAPEGVAIRCEGCTGLGHMRPESRVKIGEDVDVVVVDIQRDSARFSVTAPANVSVHREEIWKDIKAEGIRSEG